MENPKQHKMPSLDKYWDKPPQQDIGSSNPDAIHLSVGRALSCWESLESSLAMLFGVFIESESQAGQSAYGAITSTQPRAEALANAAAFFADRNAGEFPADEFSLMLKHYRAGAARRNEIAHGMAMTYRMEDVDKGVFLVPAMYNTRKNTAKTTAFWMSIQNNVNADPYAVFGQSYRYTSKDIDSFSSKFDELAEAVRRLFLDQFMMSMRKRMGITTTATIQLGTPK